TIIGILGIGMFGQTMFEKLLQATGKTFYSMITQIVGAVTNIIMDPILIFGVGPFPKMGVAGAAVATIFGQILGTALAIYFNLRFNKEISISFKKYPLTRETVQSIYGIGLPSIFMQAVGSVMTFGLNKILVSFSSTAVAVFGVYFKLQSFTFMPIFGLNNGMMPLVSYNFGARKPERIMQAMRLGLVASISIMLICFTVFQCFPTQLLLLFSASENMLAIGIPALRIISIHFLAAGISVICMAMFQALGHAPNSLLISISRQLLVLLPAAYVLSRFGNINLVWWAFPIAEIASVLMCVILLRRVLNKEVRPLFEAHAN
ncbi:MAG: polysaccharide biosynthesis C-terminal domain-containing protein, partial [Lachnospiraceae bacterium]|nr:polysaccharide biosynthesis C-terminal domain-containing protein [Lachnospiraceae bacterium]